jgi:hypothetical protein
MVDTRHCFAGQFKAEGAPHAFTKRLVVEPRFGRDSYLT